MTYTSQPVPIDYMARKQRFADLVNQSEAAMKEVNLIAADMAAIEKVMLEDMIEAGGENGTGEQSYTLNGRTFFRQKTLIVSKGAGKTTQEVCDTLKELGFGDLVTREDSYGGKLKSRVREMLKSKEGIPKQLKELLYVAQPIRLRHRKAAK